VNEPASIANSQRLEMAVAEFLECLDRGESPDRAAILLQYADIAAELGEFFTDHDRIEQFARPNRAIDAQQAPTISHQPTPNCDSDTTWQVAFESQPTLPTQIGPYTILAELGRGGMGIVFRARHAGLDREVALKTILAGQFASPEDLSRFGAEATAAATLDHQGIVPIFDMGQFAGQPYFAMPLIQGQTLAERLKSGALPPLTAVKLLAKIAAAVAYAHVRGVIHRDLKPGNILLAPGQSEASNTDPLLNCDPKITDFGLAKRLSGGLELTLSGQILGTPSYMPPEQASGKRHEIGPAADIYALGAILYAMLTGRPPFHSDNPVEAILQVIEREPPLPRSLQPGVPQELEWICLKCLEKKPADRYASATDLLADLERFLRHEPPLARPPNIAQRLRRWVRRKPILAAHWIGLSASLLLVQLVYLVHPERDLTYHLRFCGVQIIWLIVSLLCQRSLEQRGPSQMPLLAWAAADALLLTWLLSFIKSPLGTFIGGYFILIAISGLASSTRLVIFTTAASMLAYLGLMLLRPELLQPPHYALFAQLTLALAGLAVVYQVWRINVLRDYYGERPGA
jgi:serine/threonine protein kinase